MSSLHPVAQGPIGPDDGIIISADFPGGNIVMENRDGPVVVLHQDLRDTEGDWFYWCFRVRGAGGRKLHFQFSRGVAMGARGPAFSSDQGETWRWLGAEVLRGNGFEHCFSPGENDVFFGMTIPYTGANWEKFLAGLGEGKAAESGVFCLSPKGRPVESLRFGCLESSPRAKVLLTARHHACESMASYVLEGVITFVLSDEMEAERLRRSVEFLAIPLVDRDGVEAGDQGKNRSPRDHNRDYGGESIYRETGAIRQRIPDWAEGKPLVALDLHCPWLRGGLNELLYLVGLPSETLWREQQRFSMILQATGQGPLPFRADDNLPFGKDWNVEASYRAGQSFSRWASELPGARLVTTLEIPYANAGGGEVNAHSAREFGRDLARALGIYLSEGG